MRYLSLIGNVSGLVIFALLLIPTQVAQADGPCAAGETPSNVGGGTICVPVSSPGEQETTSGGETATETVGEATCTDSGQVIPCVTDEGVWSSVGNCYAYQLPDNQYPPDAPYWEGNDPASGSLWICTNNPFGSAVIFFVAGEEAPALVDPGVLAQQALDQMKLATPAISMAPAPPLRTYVGLETWLWMPPEQFAPLSLTVTAGPTAVTVVAQPVRSTWDMSTGSTTCTSAGRPWIKGYDDSQTTDCAYTYDQVSTGQSDDAFPVSATLVYQVDWTCAGTCLTTGGTLGEVNGAPGVAAIEVGERQSVVVQ